MGSIDTESKKYMSDNAHFADAFNYLIYDGRSVIDPAALHPLDSTEIVIPYGNEAREPNQKYRDILKVWQIMTDGEAIYAVLGEEIQTNIHYAMPVKDMLYDSMQYAKQVEEAKKSYRDQNGKEQKIRLTGSEFLSGFRKEDKLMPVITLAIYFGADNWDGPMCIHEMFITQNEKLLHFVPDYRINLIAPAQIADDDFLKFNTDFGKVLQYIKYSKDKEKIYEITHEGDRFRNVDEESANLINVTTGSELKYEAKGGRVNMCIAIDEMRKDARNEGWNAGLNKGRDEGRDEGRIEALGSLVKDGILTSADAAKRAGLSLTEFLAKTAGM